MRRRIQITDEVLGASVPGTTRRCPLALAAAKALGLPPGSCAAGYAVVCTPRGDFAVRPWNAAERATRQWDDTDTWPKRRAFSLAPVRLDKYGRIVKQ